MGSGEIIRQEMRSGIQTSYWQGANPSVFFQFGNVYKVLLPGESEPHLMHETFPLTLPPFSLPGIKREAVASNNQAFIRAVADPRYIDMSTAVTLPPHEHYITHFSVSADGAQIASADAGGVVQISEAASGRLLHRLHLGSVPFVAVQLFANATRLMTATLTRTTVWDIASGKELFGVVNSVGDLLAAEMIQARNSFYTLDTTGRVRFWNADDGELQFELAVPKESVRAIALSPDGALLAVGRDEGVQLWRIVHSFSHTRVLRSPGFWFLLVLIPLLLRSLVSDQRNARGKNQTAPMPAV